MEKNIKFENLIAGALVIFGKVDRLSMSILLDYINDYYNINMNEEPISSKYIVSNYGEYKIAGNSEEEIVEARVNLSRLQGQEVIDFFAELSCQDLILSKVNALKGLHIEDTKLFFSNVEQIILEELKKEKLVTIAWNKNFSQTKYQEYVLTNAGKARIFHIEYREEINEFIQTLNSMGMNSSLIDEFLSCQDYDKGLYEILDIDNFRIFCLAKGKELYKPVQYEAQGVTLKLKFPTSEKIDET